MLWICLNRFLTPSSGFWPALNRDGLWPKGCINKTVFYFYYFTAQDFTSSPWITSSEVVICPLKSLTTNIQYRSVSICYECVIVCYEVCFYPCVPKAALLGRFSCSNLRYGCTENVVSANAWGHSHRLLTFLCLLCVNLSFSE